MSLRKYINSHVRPCSSSPQSSRANRALRNFCYDGSSTEDSTFRRKQRYVPSLDPLPLRPVYGTISRGDTPRRHFPVWRHASKFFELSPCEKWLQASQGNLHFYRMGIMVRCCTSPTRLKNEFWHCYPLVFTLSLTTLPAASTVRSLAARIPTVLAITSIAAATVTTFCARHWRSSPKDKNQDGRGA